MEKGDLEKDISEKNQLVDMMWNVFEKMERAYTRKDGVEFNKMKAMLMQTQKRILEI